ncbi:MAG: YjgP/YjgQ family permease [Bacteroidetes bacterium]|nr:YjgP/YjgQ family permease [Bacteroidota bacterium]
MRKIDWYILRNFLTTFFFSLILLTLISTVIDISEHTDDFARHDLTAGQIFIEYYLGFIPHIVAMLFPLFVFISVIFFTSKMANRSEFIAILSSGVSLQRILRPYWVGGVFLGALLWYGNDYIIPKANTIRTDFESKYIARSMINQSGSGIYMRTDSFSYAGMRFYDTSSKSGGSFFTETIRDNQVVYNLRAENFAWDTSTKTWKLNGVVERKIKGYVEDVKFFYEIHRKLPFVPSDLHKDEFLQSRMISPDLRRRIEQERLRGSETVRELEMESAHRMASPVTVVILTIIGAIIAFRRIRGGSGSHLAVGIIICAVFILTDRFSTIFSTKGNLNPYLAAWIPNFLFGALTVYIYKKAPK